MTPNHVVCPENITGPHASQEYAWMPDNLPCGVACPVVEEAEVMHFKCGRGHSFYATPAQIVRASA